MAADTAGAAAEIAERKDPTVAAIASDLAAKIYGLQSLAANIEDAEHNTTRFLVMSREPKEPAPGSGPCITTFVFRVRNVPAALYKAMGGFATNSVNMTKLESYQINGAFTATLFYADVEGHPAGCRCAQRARGTRLLLTRGAHPGRIPGSSLPLPGAAGDRRRLNSATAEREFTAPPADTIICFSILPLDNQK